MSLTPAQAALLGGVNGYAASRGVPAMMAGGITPLAASNPYSAAAMGIAQVGTALLGGPDPNNTSGVNGYRNMVDSHLDGSGWTVSTGSSKASSVPTLASAAQAVAQQAMTSMSNPMLMIGAVLLVAVWRRKG